MENNYEVKINHGNVKDKFILSNYEKNKFIRQLNNNVAMFAGFFDIDKIHYHFIKREIKWVRVEELERATDD